ncbi:bacteriocin [Flavobacterium anhuiense]|uniref:bacteriocin n=1 Tax=Flavobacterium anhuiense TaxID=459526 RepID=UPI000E6C2659|nr:bacteriocin [Flavobacterium anhuiense]URM36681.1 bacteriocin [Flavobacterium anhuiense]
MKKTIKKMDLSSVKTLTKKEMKTVEGGYKTKGRRMSDNVIDLRGWETAGPWTGLDF